MRVSSAQMPTDDMWQLAPDASTALIASTQPSKRRDAVVDVLRVGGIGRVQLGGDGELARAAARAPAVRARNGRAADRAADGRPPDCRRAGSCRRHLRGFRARPPPARSRAARRRSRAASSRPASAARGSRRRACMRRLPSQACTQTHGMSGSTSQWPLARTPPQGPFRSRFGQFIGHDMPVEERMHWPHMRQSKRSPFTRRSTNFTGGSARAVADEIPERMQVQEERRRRPRRRARGSAHGAPTRGGSCRACGAAA